MADRVFVYVDGESHFIRSQCAWRKLHGEGASLDALRPTGETDGQSTLILPKGKVFWTRSFSAGVQRTVYFTSVSGDEAARHVLMLALRTFDLEPSVILERRQLADRRRNALDNRHLIEKPKGIDIALAVRMLEDAANQAFDACHLYTSDADFLPVIEALIGRGKQVKVFGYKDGLSTLSRLLVVPDQFVDLERVLQSDCELAPNATI